MQIKEMPISERPYEKLEMYGAETLSNSELLAIIIKNGTKDKTSIQLAQQILSIKKDKIENNNMRFLQDTSIEEFQKINGIGKVKAIQLRAVCELTKRISRPIEDVKIKIITPIDVANLLMDELRFEKREKVKVLILNTKNVLLKIIDVSYGGTDFAIVEPKDVLSEAIKMGAPNIILVHNHPSGDSKPSKEDINTTKRLYEASQIMGIRLIDHIVLGDGNFESIVLYMKKMKII